MKKAFLFILVFFLFLSTFFFKQSFAQTSFVTTNYQTTSNTSYCYQFRYYLVRGSTDASTQGEVSRLQNILYNMKLLSVAPTGYFGTMTEQAVKQYQASRNIQATGTVGPITRQALSNCNTQQPINPSTNTNVLPVTFYSFNQKSILQIPIGTVLTLPNLTAKSEFPNYVFNGWYLDSSFVNKYNSTPINSAISLYAKWVKNCSATSSVTYPNNCDGGSALPTVTTCASNLEFPLKNSCTCAVGFVKISYGDPMDLTAICLPKVANCPINNYFYNWDYPGCVCPQGYNKQSGIPGIDENIDHCVAMSGGGIYYPTTSSNDTTTTTTTTITETSTYTPVGEMKECQMGSYTITVPVEINCPGS